MHSQMSSGASAPILAPPPSAAPSAPTLVPPKPKGNGPKRLGWIVFLILAAIGVERGIHFARKPSPAAQSAAIVVRTGTVTQGAIDRTIRLTGTTGAEKFSSLISPQLRGNRSGGGRDGLRGGGGGGGGSSSQLQSRGTGSSSGGGGSSSGGSSSSSSGMSGDTSSASAAPSITSTNGQNVGGGSQAFRNSTSRINRTPSSSGGSTGTGSPSTTSSPSSSSPSTSNLGSTSGSLIGSGTGGSGGGGGGGGGASEFMLVLQDAASPGSKVKKGQVVAEFDRQYMMQRLEDYRASVAQIEASIRKLEAELKVTLESHAQTIANAKADLEKARLDVQTIPVLGRIDAERTRLAAEEAEAKYKQLLAEVKFVQIGQQSQLKNARLEQQQAHVELRRAEANADRMLIKAPIDGLAVMQNTRRGTEFAQIQPGDQLFPGMMFMQIVDTSSMVINASVNQVDVDSLRLGQKAMVRFDAYPDLQVPAHVDAIGAMTRPGGMRAAFVKDIPVILKIDRMDPRIIPDLSVSIDVVIESEQQATLAPLSAVFHDSPDTTPYVYVRNDNGWERRDVEIGIANNIQVAVRSGLKPGELVAEDPPPSLNSSSATKVSGLKTIRGIARSGPARDQT